MPLHKSSPCKVNLVLNILGCRPDGFHELETLMHPVSWFDELTFAATDVSGEVHLTCNDPTVPADQTNLAHRAAALFFASTGMAAGIKIHLEKRIPAAAGLGGGSGNAAVTLLALNELFDHPLEPSDLSNLAGQLGSDVPFFLQNGPALATGRGEEIQPLPSFPALRGAAFVLARPGFGVSTAWAYGALARYPMAREGRRGRAAELAKRLTVDTWSPATSEAFYNSLEAPVLEKYPLLAMLKEYFQDQGASAALMSGSGSTVFAIAPDLNQAKALEAKVRDKFAPIWTCSAEI